MNFYLSDQELRPHFDLAANIGALNGRNIRRLRVYVDFDEWTTPPFVVLAKVQPRVN